MRLLITGSAGFIGTALKKRVLAKAKYCLTVVSRRLIEVEENVKLVQISNITTDTDWSAALESVDVVIHTAARAHVLNETSTDPLIEFRKTNVQGALALAKQALVSGVKRFIFISSIGVNGESTSGKPFTEDSALLPHAPYAVSKLEAEIALQELCKGSSMELVIIRPPLVYAAHAPGNFERLLKLVFTGIPLPFALVENQRSMIALENLVDFVMCCVEHPAAANQTFLIADTDSISTPDILHHLAEGMDKKIRLLPVPINVMRFFAKLVGRSNMFDQLCGSLKVDASKARTLLQWQPKLTVHEAMIKAGQNYLENKKKTEAQR